MERKTDQRIAIRFFLAILFKVCVAVILALLVLVGTSFLLETPLVVEQKNQVQFFGLGLNLRIPKIVILIVFGGSVFAFLGQNFSISFSAVSEPIVSGIATSRM